MPFIEVEQGKLFYEIRGEGNWLVLLHGAWACQEWWSWQVPYLAQKYRVLTLDLRGHGQSSPLREPHSVEGFTRDLEIFLQKVGITEVVLIGWSMGGMISIQYCLQNPWPVRALILIATRGHRHPDMKRRILFQYLKARLSLLVDLAAPRKYDRGTESFPGERERIEEEFQAMLAPAAPLEVREWVKADLEHHPRKNYFEIAKSFWDWEAGEKIRKITLPTLILVGSQDVHTPPACAHSLNRIIPGSQLIIVEGAGHCLPLECPERVNREIVEFLKKVGY